MINRLGWMPDQHYVSDVDSECSVDSLTNADQAKLDDFFSFLSMPDITVGENSSETDSDCSDTNSVVAPPFSPIRVTENEAPDVDNVESDQEESRTQILVPCHEDMPVLRNIWNGFKLVMDNVDKNYRQSFHQMDKKTTSIHYVHYYAVRDRIDLSSCSETQPTAPIDVQKLIVDEDDLTLVTDDAIVLIARYSFVQCVCFCCTYIISRILSQHMDCFKSQLKDVPLHIESNYVTEMSVRSEVV